MTDAPLPRLAVLASGTGRTLENLCRLATAGELGAEVALLVTDRPGVRALEVAAAFDVPSLVLPWREVGGAAPFAERAFAAIEERGCALVVLAGFLRLVVLPDRWRGRVLNVHPSLLPAYGGKGFYGDRVHAAVLAERCATTGCTVHLVDDEYDRGEIVLQREVPVRPDDTVDTLAARVFEEEKRALPEAIRRMLGS